jgi:hypothetical protein
MDKRSLETDLQDTLDSLEVINVAENKKIKLKNGYSQADSFPQFVTSTVITLIIECRKIG